MILDLSQFLGIIFMSIATQFIVKAIRKCCSKKMKSPIPQIMSMIIGVLLCVLSGLDMFVAFGYPLEYAIVGQILTGSIASLGANGIFDIYTQMNEYKEKLAVEKNKSN